MEGSRTLTIRPYEFNFEGEGYNYTKVLGLKCYSEDKQKIVREQPTTWAGLAREVINAFSYEIEREVERDEEGFEKRFNEALKQMLDVHGFKTNASFSEVLFSEPTHLKSVLYRNNQNSMLKIYDVPESTESRYITAVYSGEVVWVINALVSALSDYGLWVEIEYIHRDELKRQLGELEEADRQLSIEDLETPQEEDTTTLEGNADIYISLLRLKVQDLYAEDRLSQEEFDTMMSYADKIAITILDAKSVLTTFNLMTKDLSKKLGIQ